MVSLQAAVAALALMGTEPTVFYDFYADWCGPCRAMSPAVEQLAQQGYPVQKVNIDKHPDLARKYGVRNIPCFVMVVGGKQVDRLEGLTSYGRLERMCKLGRQLAAQQQAPPPATQPPTPTVPPVVPIPPTDNPRILPVSKNQAPNGTPTGPLSDDDLIAATVRLRVREPGADSCGSGTIIDSRQGEALILTCGHLFRGSRGEAQIEVDLFGPNAAKAIPGRLLSYGLTPDVGLVAIRIPGPVKVVPVATPGTAPKRGDRVACVGCSHGDAPTVWHSQINSVNRYEGPANLQVAGQSVEGRSGGGVFSADGRVIAVNNAAEPQDNEAYCAALGAIHSRLDAAGLKHIYQSSTTTTGAAPDEDRLATVPPAMPDQMPGGPTPDPRRQWESPTPPATDLAAEPADPAREELMPLSEGEQATLDEIVQRLREGAEMVCVIHSRKDPKAKSEVLLLNQVSPAFLQHLATEVHSQRERQLTSAEIPRAPEPPLNTGSTPAGRLVPIGAPAATANNRFNGRWQRP